MSFKIINSEEFRKNVPVSYRLVVDIMTQMGGYNIMKEFAPHIAMYGSEFAMIPVQFNTDLCEFYWGHREAILEHIEALCSDQGIDIFDYIKSLSYLTKYGKIFNREIAVIIMGMGASTDKGNYNPYIIRAICYLVLAHVCQQYVNFLREMSVFSELSSNEVEI